MAEYKGLTIRIGGDTSQLNSALKASTKSAAALQNQIRQITRAMRFDPGNLEHVNTRMKLTTNRAESLYSKIHLLRNAYDELGESTVKVGGSVKRVKELAETTENVALAAKTAEERYNDMTANLAANYRKLEARAKEAGKAMDLSALSRQGTGDTFEKQMADLKELGVVTDEEIQKLREMRATWKEAFDSSEGYKAAAQFEAMSVDIQRFEAEAKSATAAVRELNTASKYSGSAWSESTAKIEQMDNALEECARQANEYEAALRKDPSNISAAVGRLKALSNEYELSKSKAEELSRQVEAYKGRLSGVLAEHQNLPKYIQEVGDEWQEAQGKLSEAKGKADALHQSLQKLKDAQAPDEEIRKLQTAANAADAEVEELARDAKRLDAAFETAKECSELQKLDKQLASATAHAKSLKERMDLTSLGSKSFLNASTIKSAGMTLYSTLTLAITMLGWRAISAAQDMDSAYRDMRKTVDGTEQQFEELKQAAIDFSKTHVTSAEQILQIEAIGGELGIATEDLRAFAETVSNLDVATNLDTEEAASSLGKLANITHMGADEYDNYADALVRLGNNGASTEDQIVEIATRIGSMGTIVGMTVPEILALSSSLASTGMKTEASGTAIANTMSDIESAVAAGGDSLAAFAGVAQMESEKFAKLWEEKPIEAIKAFVEGLNTIEDGGGSANNTLEELGITGTRQKQAILGLMQTIGGLNTNLEMSRDAWEGVSDKWGAAGDAAREAQKKAEGFSGQISILSNIGNDAMASLADGAVPVISVLTTLAQAALDAFDGMDDGAKTLSVVGLGIGAVSGPLLTMASTFMIAKDNVATFLTETSAMGRAMGIVKAGFADAGAGADGMKVKLTSLGEAAKTVGKSIGRSLATAAVVAGITLAVAAIADYIKKMRDAKEASSDAADVIGSALAGAVVEQGKAITDLNGNYDEMVEKMAQNNRRLQESAEKTYGNVDLIEEYGEGVQEALDAYNEGDRSAESMANLKTQLELYNSAAGTSITFTEDETGKLVLMKDGAELTAEAFDALAQSMINAAKAEFFKEGYTTKMEDYRTAVDEVAKAEENAKSAQEAMNEAAAEGDWDAVKTYKEQLDIANETLDKSKQKLEETSTAMNQYKEGMELIAAADAAGAESAQQWVADHDELQVAMWNSGESVTDFAEILGKLNLDYDTLDSKSKVVEKMGKSWDGSIASLIPGLRKLGVEIDKDTAGMLGLDAVQVGDKTYYVSDDGTIVKQNGKLAKLNTLLVDDKVYTVDDQGTIWDGVQAVGELSDDVASLPDGQVNVTAVTDPATQKVSGWVAKTNLIKATTKTSTDTSEADKKVKESVKKADESKGTIGVGANSTSFWSSVNKIDGSTVGTAYINVVKKGGSYTGGYSQTPWDLSSAQRMATGAIVTGPVLTNNGWVGEDGAEAVLNWATGGAVIPLTNHKYMEPIAAAIAKNMDGSRTNAPTYNVSVYLEYNAGEDASQIAEDIARALERKLAMEA